MTNPLDRLTPAQREYAEKNLSQTVTPADDWTTDPLPEGGEGAEIETEEHYENSPLWESGLKRYGWLANPHRNGCDWWDNRDQAGVKSGDLVGGLNEDGEVNNILRWRWVTRPAEKPAEVPSNCWTCVHSGHSEGVPGRCDVYGLGLTATGKGISRWWFGIDRGDETGMPPRAATGCPGYEPAEAQDTPPPFTATADRAELVTRVREQEAQIESLLVALREVREERDGLRSEAQKATSLYGEASWSLGVICDAVGAPRGSRLVPSAQEHVAAVVDERDELRARLADYDDPDFAARRAIDEIAALTGCAEWDYPAQVVRDVKAITDSHAELVRERDELRAKLDCAIDAMKARQ